MLTLGVRGERHARNAAALAEWLERQDGVDRVLYPGLPSHPQHATAMRQFRPGAAGEALIDHLTLSELTASLGSAHTMVVHPPSTSQRQMTEPELLAAGISPGLLRVSVGLEDVEDIEADIADALVAARAVRAPATPAAV
jgi:cystathionine beta-lyase/cystathionine gamma-synthase